MPTDQTLVHLTPAALDRLKALHERDSEPIVRLSVTGETCCGHRFGLSFEDEVADGDTVTTANGVTLVVGPASRTPCEGATLDYVEIEGEAGFMVRPADPAPACACGSAPS